MNFISLENITFSYNSSESKLLSDFSVEIPDGWTGISGRNGCGKTTLLKIINGELKPESGSVSHSGSAYYIDQRTDKEPNLFSEFLYHGDNTSGKLISLLRIEPDWPQRWDTLSHGERKRVQAGIAVWMNPAILLVDEPFNHLDNYSSNLLYEAFKEYRGIGVIVSHNREILDRLCDRCIFMDPPDAVLRNGNYTDGKAMEEKEINSLLKMKNEQKRRVKKIKRSIGNKRRQADKSDKRVSKGRVDKKDHDSKAKIDLARLSGKDSKPGREVKVLESRFKREMDKLGRIKIKKEYKTGIDLLAERSKRKYVLNYDGGKIPIEENLSLFVPELVVGNSDRIGISGINGSGKSTLMERLVKLSNRDQSFYLPQEVNISNALKTLNNIKKYSPERKGELFSLVRRLDSDPANLLASQNPSPGEIRKILIAEGIQRKPEIIFMDEPTNHLDIVSIECLESALEDFKGALLLISHDERFLENLTNRRLEFNRYDNLFCLEERL